MRIPVLAALVFLLAGCLEADPRPTTTPPPETPATTGSWLNKTVEGSFVGAGVYPTAALTIVGETLHEFKVPEGSRFLRLVLDADNAVYWVADPTCTGDTWECRNDRGWADDAKTTWEAADPRPGTWRFEIGGTGTPAYAGPVDYTMRIDLLTS